MFFPGEFHGWECKELDMTEWLSTDYPNGYLCLPNKEMNEFGYVLKMRLASSLIPSICLLLSLRRDFSLPDKNYNLVKTKCVNFDNLSWRIKIVRTRHGTKHWFQIGKGVYQGCICHTPYLTYMQSTSWETLGWRKHKLESRLQGEISITSDMQMTPPLWQKVKKN